jgi:ATP-dependent exoDNAse (exonuclease V) alpha subunit
VETFGQKPIASSSSRSRSVLFNFLLNESSGHEQCSAELIGFDLLMIDSAGTISVSPERDRPINKKLRLTVLFYVQEILRQFLARLAPQERVLLIGDADQDQGVEAGRPFEQMQEAGMRTAKLDEIVRQKDQALKSAVELLAAGQVSSALDVLQEQGRIKENCRCSITTLQQRKGDSIRTITERGKKRDAFSCGPGSNSTVIPPYCKRAGDVNPARTD